MRIKIILVVGLVASVVVLAGCETMKPEEQARLAAMNESIRAEIPGNYFIGRRMYKADYKMWGWVRKPGQSWKDSQLVMLNEQRMLAPDRTAGKLGSDNGYEYRLEGYFSGQKVYEPASDTIYPEFVFTGGEVRSRFPVNIYQQQRQNQPAVRLLTHPMY